MGVAICSDLVEEEVVVKDCDAFAHNTLSNLPHPQGGVEGCGIGQGVHPGSDWVGEDVIQFNGFHLMRDPVDTSEKRINVMRCCCGITG